jgi:hypothetical protein
MKMAIFLTLFLFTSSAYGELADEGKVYVTPDQIEITEEGIFAYIKNAKRPIVGRTLAFDHIGMYIKEWRGPCFIHDLWCRRCGGCGVLFCPMNCSCYD